MKTNQLYMLLVREKEEPISYYAMVTWDRKKGEITLVENESYDSKDLVYAKNVRIATKEKWKECIKKDTIKELRGRPKGWKYGWTYKMIPVEIIN